MKQYGVRGPLSDPPQLGEYVVVAAWEVEAAITAARADEREKARHDFQTACIDIELLIQTLIGVNERLGGSGGISDIL